jgi:cytidylate kinase
MTVKRPPHVVIAIDGPSGVGKSTVAQRLAQVLGYRYVASGVMYRAVGWAIQAHTVPRHDTTAIVEFLARTTIDLLYNDNRYEIWVNGQQVTCQLGGETAGRAGSDVAIIPAVREVITAKLRRLRCQADLVMEGRDIGTVVFPDATVKFFLEASLAARSQRRFRDMQQAGHVVTLEQVMQAIVARDAQDRGRTVAPLVAAVGAYAIDTTDLAVDDVVQTMLSEIQRHRVQGNG